MNFLKYLRSKVYKIPQKITKRLKTNLWCEK